MSLGPPQGPTGPPLGPPSGPHGPAGPLGPPPAPPSGRSGNRRLLLIAGVVAVLIIAVVAVLTLSGDDASAGEVFTEPIDSLGDDPFVEQVPEPLTPEQVTAITELPDQPADEQEGVETFDGATAGLYGGTRDDGRCDADQLVAFLESRPAEADAWAGVLGIEVDGIAAYVDTLTPTVLRADTRVTNHGFRNGEATPLQSVLQAGTAVLVDPSGAPVVKCSCGNPLGPPSAISSPTYTGDTWDGFDPDRVITITPAVVVIDIFVLIDIDTGDRFGRPPGSKGDGDVTAPDSTGSPPPGGVTTTTAPPTTSTTPAGVPAEASFAGAMTGTTGPDCGTVTASVTFTADVAGGSITIVVTTPNGTVSSTGPVSADGTFEFLDSVALGFDGFSGNYDADSFTASTISDVCTLTFTGQRSD